MTIGEIDIKDYFDQAFLRCGFKRAQGLVSGRGVVDERGCKYALAVAFGSV